MSGSTRVFRLVVSGGAIVASGKVCGDVRFYVICENSMGGKLRGEEV